METTSKNSIPNGTPATRDTDIEIVEPTRVLTLAEATELLKAHNIITPRQRSGLEHWNIDDDTRDTLRQAWRLVQEAIYLTEEFRGAEVTVAGGRNRYPAYFNAADIHEIDLLHGGIPSDMREISSVEDLRKIHDDD